MKKIFKTLVCGALMAMLLCIPAMAANDAPAVMLNGEEVTFTDAAPQIVNDRTFVPLRAVSNALGISDESIAWDEESKTVTIDMGDYTISLTVGEYEVVITEGEKSNTITTDVAAFIDGENDRTYVPVRFIAEAMNCNVGWDSNDRVVIIDDVAKLLAANTETYTIIDKYLEYSNSYSNKAFAGTADFDISMTVMGETLALGGEMTMIQKYLAIQYDMTLDLAALAAADETIPASIKMEMRGDLETGVVYLTLGELMEELGVSGDVWLKMDMSAMLADMGMDYEGLIDLGMNKVTDMSMQEYLAYLCAMTPLEDASYTTSDMIAEINAIIGDSAFTQNGSNYTSKMDADGVKMELTITMNGDKATGYSMTMSTDVEGISMTVASSMTGGDMDFTMEIKYADADISMDMTMSMKGTYSDSNTAPVVTPPTGATIIDINDMIDLTGVAA